MMQEPTKKEKNYKYQSKEIAMAAIKKRKNRARREWRCCAHQYWMAAQDEKVPQKQVQECIRKQKMQVRKDYKKTIKHTKQ